jgi:hypothetical protein
MQRGEIYWRRPKRETKEQTEVRYIIWEQTEDRDKGADRGEVIYGSRPKTETKEQTEGR